ncbi:hypothetical protein C0992_009675 [Termitomyces sp. T32_za158]|nr:hypothetical protein C0992_009675 [Termitomyces sp. T32_za158]
MLNYYPPEINLAQLARKYPELELVDEDEEQRLQDIEDRKKRGKGAPKKAKTKAVIFVMRGHSLTCSHPRRFNILPPPANSISETTAPSRIGECVRGRLLRRPFLLPSRSSITAFARAFARAIVHAGFITAVHGEGSNQPAMISLSNWILTTIYLIILTTPLAGPEESMTVPIITDDAALTVDPPELTISVDLESAGLRHLQPPQAAYLPTSTSRRSNDNFPGLLLPPKRHQTAPS